MLSPYKMYKFDVQNQHKKKVTWGPKGNPLPSIGKGSLCYEHYNVDWAVHRLTPEVMDRSKTGGRAHRTLASLAERHSGAEGVAPEKMAQHLRNTSPRWGEGHAPGRRPRYAKPRPTSVNVSRKTVYVVAGAAAVGAGGAYYYRRRKNKLERVRKAQHHDTFTATHSAITAKRH